MQITLHPKEGATMAPGLPVRIHCLAGTLWITSERDSNDRVLTPGQSIELPATHRQYLSSVGRHELVSFDVSGALARISVNRSGATAASPARDGVRAWLQGVWSSGWRVA
ncbi:hypothetical protein ASD15_25425 [Massilia sp. Root351]|jgi:hypothetical protein|uniref:DUF2917 domain-containing protein n=1 Tax=Massilia sp. Root351 TaxID=1736522 RepID=UPI00070AC912|nr:DUF2917 domain-containing protein [Massilia sp. Root351]KQV90023.1 hypothetical protein ASD15_25425 [Massilia sp. Root351]